MTSPPPGYPSSGQARLGSLASASSGGLGVIQERIALFAKVGFLISAVFYAMGWYVHFSFIGASLTDEAHSHVDQWHAGATLVFLSTWLLARRKRPYSFGALALIDAGSLVLIATAFAGMAYQSRDLAGVHVGLLAVFSTVVLRAVLVPSEARRTAWMTALAVSSIPIVASFLIQDPAVTGYRQHLGTIPEGYKVSYIIGQGLWAAAATVVATIASSVIYGLHEEVRAARQLGQYTLEDKIGEGGMGSVYRARHAMLRRPTAVKLLHPDVSERQIKRFEREVQLTAMLTHPHTIVVYDYGRTPEGIFYYAMEYLDGFNLDVLVQIAGPQAPGRVIHWMRQACGALSEAHSVGLIHRDVKPANVYVCERGGYPDFVKVLDFGLVKEIDGGDAGRVSISTESVITGTPLYLSPEAIKTPKEIDARSDLYALGCVAYYLLTGANVFEGGSVVEICGHHLHTHPEPPSARLGKPIASDLETIVLDCLAKNPDNRPATARALADRLAACADAGSWNESSARAWWDGHRNDFKESSARVAATSPHPKTIDVDLEARRLR